MHAVLLACSPAPLMPDAPDFLAKELVELWARMYSNDLLEYDHFLPHIASTPTLKWPIFVTKVSFKLDMLEMACSHKLQELDDDEYITLLWFGLLLPHITHLQDAGFVQHLYHCSNPIYSKIVWFLAAEVQHLASSGEASCIVLSGRDLEHHMGKVPIFFKSIRWQPQQQCEVILCLELDKAEPMSCPLHANIDADHAMVQDTISQVLNRKGKKANKEPVE